MSQPDDLTRRVEAAEKQGVETQTQVIVLRQQITQAVVDAAAARGLAAGADHEVSLVRAELRAHTGVIDALREDQISMRAELRAQIAELREETRQGFATLDVGVTRIVSLLAGISPPG